MDRKPSFDMDTYIPEMIKETKDFILFKMPIGFSGMPIEVLEITQKLYDMGYQVVQGSNGILCKKRGIFYE